MLADGRPAEPDTQRDTRLRHQGGAVVLRPAPADRTAARHHLPQFSIGRADGDCAVPLRRDGWRTAGQGSAAAHSRPVPPDNVADVLRQPEVQRHHRRPGHPDLQGSRPHLRTDGGPALQGWPEVVLPDEHRAGVPPLQRGPQLCRTDRRGTGVRPLYRYWHHRQLRSQEGPQGHRYRVCARGH